MQWEVAAGLSQSTPDKRREEIKKILLKNRGILGRKRAQEFLDPPKPETISPARVGIDTRNLKKAVARIKTARDKKESVVVYGDYDADGICSTAILWEALFASGVRALPFIPQRESHGYGLSKRGIDDLLKVRPSKKIPTARRDVQSSEARQGRTFSEKPSLIITVDNGIVANAAVEYAKQKGIDVIVCDHHEKAKQLPKALAVIHTTSLAGAGVTWIFASLLFNKLTKTKNHHSGLDLATIGTVADMVPLVGPNRTLVKSGLGEVRRTKRLGLIQIMQDAMIAPQEIDTHHITYLIAPRLNAVGRLRHAVDALRLLCTKNPQRAKVLAQKIGSANKARRQLMEEMLIRAKSLYLMKAKRTQEKIIIIDHQDFHEGIIGLIAGKMVEEFYRPTIVLSRGRELSKASARSIPGWNIIKSIRQLENLLVDVGGHPMAAGFTIETQRIGQFRQEMRRLAEEELNGNLLQKTLKIECELTLSDITKLLYKEIQTFEPFGMTNPLPIFATRNVVVRSVRQVGSDRKHLKLAVESEAGTSSGQIFAAIGFGMGELAQGLELGSRIDIAYSIDLDSWNGEERLQLKIKDLKKSEVLDNVQG